VYHTELQHVSVFLSNKYRKRFGTHRLLSIYKTDQVWFSGINTNVDSGIYECEWDSYRSEWVIVTKRNDKDKPNSLTTVVNTLLNLEECIRKEDLLL
jgi:hypothetical protein